ARRPTASAAAAEVAPPASIAATFATTSPGIPPEIPTVHDRTSLASPSRTRSAHCPEQASCELVVVGTSIAKDDAGGWLRLATTMLVSTSNFATLETS